MLIYSKLENSDTIKHNKAKEFLGNLSGIIFLSTQVVNELYTVLVRNKIADIIIQESITDILTEVELRTIELKTIYLAWEIRAKFHYSYYDCLIVASALEAKCSILYSEDLHHNQLVKGSLKIINPFFED